MPATSGRHQRCSADSGPNAGLSDSPSGRLTRHSTSLGASSHLGQPKERDTPNALDKAYPTTQIQPSNPEGPEVVHLRVSFTKELDGDTGLVYMYQRWYLAEAGIFVSKASHPPMVESQYGFARGAPTKQFDPRGEAVEVCCSDVDWDSVAGDLINMGGGHCWLTTSSIHAGLGGGSRSPAVVDHKHYCYWGSFKTVSACNEECVARRLRLDMGKPTSWTWLPLANDCQGYVKSVLRGCGCKKTGRFRHQPQPWNIIHHEFVPDPIQHWLVPGG